MLGPRSYRHSAFGGGSDALCHRKAGLAVPAHQVDQERARNAEAFGPFAHRALGLGLDIRFKRAHVDRMSQVATSGQELKRGECLDYGRALCIAAFYVRPMALRIKELRQARGWTQADLADKARMSRSQLAMIEAETRPANTLRLNAIAAALGVDAQDLFDNPDAHLIELVRRMGHEDREALVRMAEALAARSDASRKP